VLSRNFEDLAALLTATVSNVQFLQQRTLSVLQRPSLLNLRQQLFKPM